MVYLTKSARTLNSYFESLSLINFRDTALVQKPYFRSDVRNALGEKCPNTEFFPVHKFPYSAEYTDLRELRVVS